MFVDVGAWRRWTILVDALDTFFFSRMQGELLVGKLVVTGQEAVEGSMQGMRADLYKKHIRQIRLRRGYALAWWNCVVVPTNLCNHYACTICDTARGIWIDPKC